MNLYYAFLKPYLRDTSFEICSGGMLSVLDLHCNIVKLIVDTDSLTLAFAAPVSKLSELRKDGISEADFELVKSKFIVETWESAERQKEPGF
jgi:hypothetical protein